MPIDLLNPWATKANMPTARYQLAAAAVGIKVYAVGGTVGDAINKNEEYDPIGNAWATKANMPTARQRLAAAAVEGKVYVVGGSPSAAQNKRLTTVAVMINWRARARGAAPGSAEGSGAP